LDVNPEGEASEWTYPPFSGHVDPQTNTIYGRGAMDDKAGVAICLGLMRVIVEQQLSFDGDLIFQFVLEDEIAGNGSLACLDAGHVADAAFILDGTRPDRAIDQHVGNMEFRLELKGRPASVSVSHLGANAAEMLARLLLVLRERFNALNETRQPPWTEFPSPYQFVVHGMSADAPRLSIPIEASARCFVCRNSFGTASRLSRWALQPMSSAPSFGRSPNGMESPSFGLARPREPPTCVTSPSAVFLACSMAQGEASTPTVPMNIFCSTISHS
jgi:Peptidase family M20/M25/M40